MPQRSDRDFAHVAVSAAELGEHVILLGLLAHSLVLFYYRTFPCDTIDSYGTTRPPSSATTFSFGVRTIRSSGNGPPQPPEDAHGLIVLVAGRHDDKKVPRRLS